MGKLIVIEGIDGSGKGTQSRLLVESLIADGHTAQLFSFPRYEQNRMGAAIGEFLNGKFGSLDQVHPFMASMLYSLDRFETRERMQVALRENDFVICDRYVASNLAHQGSRVQGEERTQLLERLKWLEFDLLQAAVPDLTVYLKLSATTARRLIAMKEKRTYTDHEADLLEEDTDYLSGVANVYQELAESMGWSVILCQNGSDIRSIEEIQDDLKSLVVQEGHA